MKKMFFLSVALCFTATLAEARFVDKGGIKDPASMVNTVAEVKQMKDNSYVVLEGKIEKRLKDEDFLFTDSTGSITVEIDDDEWQGQTVTPQDTVEIKGKFDKGVLEDEIDVKQIRLIQKQ